MNSITIMNDDDPSEQNIDYIKKIAEYTLLCENKDNCSFSIVCCTDATMMYYNQTYRGKNESTDVLTFVFLEGEVFPNISADNDEHRHHTHMLGDMLICREQIQQQANEYHISYREELGRIIVHGTLHLLGYTHKSYDSNEPMLLKQELLLSNYYEMKGRI